MKYFKNVQNAEELKKEYKRLARENHPDMGGDIEIMKAINAEFDMLLAILPTEVRENVRAEVSEFYTQNGWKGKNYDFNLSTKEIATKVREFVKNIYPECKFSVTFETASMCSEIHVALVESPYRCNKTVEELTNDELYDGHYSYNYQYGHETTDEQKAYFLKNCYTDEIERIRRDVDNFVKSYRYSDCDGMIDYFDTNFYYFGVQVGKWNKPYVQNEARLAKKRKVLVEV
jgi:hypothetical protein